MVVNKDILHEAYDVIIVGGGPAGCVAAQYSSKSGARTILFERDPVIGKPVRCGEGVSQRGIKGYAPLSGPWIINKPGNVEFIAPDNQKILVPTDYVGYILDRSEFDKYLGDRAVELGAIIVTEADVTGLTYENGRPSGVSVTYHGDRHNVAGRVIIGADGVESRVGRWAGLKTATKFNNMESAVQVLVTGIKIDASKIGLYFGREVAPGGYAWIFPKNENSANVGLAISGNFAREKHAEKYLNEFLGKHFPNAAYSAMVAGGIPCNPPLKKMVGHNVLVAGDAGHTVNPMTGAGIANALQSGKIAGEIAAKASADPDNMDTILQQYPRRWFRSRGKHMKRFNRLKQFIQKLDDKQFNELATLLKGVPQKEWSLLKIFLFAVRNKPDLVIDAVILFRNF